MAKNYTLISWNVNGIRAAEKKGFLDWLGASKADVVALQETKVQDIGLLSEELRNPTGYFSFWHSAQEKKGYSGTAVYSQTEPVSFTTNFGKNNLSTEGRIVQLEFPEFYFLNIYFPNGGGEDHRLAYKLKFFDEFLTYIKKLDKTKPVIFCGDVNVAHKEIDIARPKENAKSIGFLPEERIKLDKFEQAGFVDTFRIINPTKVEYSWWDQKSRARDRNIGWRIDYFWVSERLKDKIEKVWIDGDVYGSDHAPVGLKIKF
ncbi:MAG: exodeoxyribonuclease III [Candidatus Vogelbacteria bacterium]|nr:exodeoxyribonuclease III [Candidatus Vogelbacteria bacterium]